MRYLNRYPSLMLLMIAMGMLSLAASTAAQVRNAPAGNEQPETTESQQAPAVSPMELFEQMHQGVPDASRRVTGMTREQHAAFARSLDLTDVRRLPVFDNGRVKILDTFAREHIRVIHGREQYRDEETGYRYDPVFTFLDILLNKRYYIDKPLIYVEVLPLRERLVHHLPYEEQERWKRLGRLAPRMVASQRSLDLLFGMDGDLRQEKASRQVLISLAVFDGQQQKLAMISPPAGSDQWIDLLALAEPRMPQQPQHQHRHDHQHLPHDHQHDHDHEHQDEGYSRKPSEASPRAAQPAALSASAMSDEQAAAMFVSYVTGDGLVEATNQQAKARVIELWTQMRVDWQRGDAGAVNRQLAELVDLLPQVNPETYPGNWLMELEWWYNVTRKFTIGYVAYVIGTIALLLAFAVQRFWLARAGLAMLLIGFAVHSAGMIVRGLITGRWPIHNQFESFIAIGWFAVLVGLLFMLFKRQWLYGAAASAVGAGVLMVANIAEIPSREMGQVAGILATSGILYIHVNVVLFSYALIALGFMISLFYLGVHYFRDESTVKLAATSITPWDQDGYAIAQTGPQRLLNDLDKAQLIVLQLAFWTLGVGTLLGAYWADHAWGRWWGWDPKETWALITWIVYLIAIHARFGITGSKRGLVTAWLSVLGFFAMLWCYWGVNMLLAGLHSYA